MAELKIQIPSSLGLSEEQIRKLEEGFQNQIADIIKGTQAEGTPLARQKVMGQNKISQGMEFKDIG